MPQLLYMSANKDNLKRVRRINPDDARTRGIVKGRKPEGGSLASEIKLKAKRERERTERRDRRRQRRKSK